MIAAGRISVVVPSFNQGRFLAATLQSLVSQADPDLEILLVDGGSTDGSVDVIRRYEKHLAWWTSQKDDGQSDALGIGFARATGEWLAWLNSDDLLLPGAMKHWREHIARDPQRSWWIGGGYFIDAMGRRLGSYTPPVALTSPAQLSDWRTHWFAQPGTLFSRALFDRAGGTVRKDLHYAMDLELWLRFLQHAAPGLIADELSAYRIHEAAKTGVLRVPAEMEIMRVLMDALGAERAMDRVACIAADRLEYQLKWQRLQALVDPVFQPALRLRAAWRRLTGGRAR